MRLRSTLPPLLSLLAACNEPTATTTDSGTTGDGSTGPAPTTASPTTGPDTGGTTEGPSTTAATSTGADTTGPGDTTTGDTTDDTTGPASTGGTTDASTTAADTMAVDTTGGSSSGTGGEPFEPDLDALLLGLQGPARADYLGGGDGGLEHSTYWALTKDSDPYKKLPPDEQKKVDAIKASVLHSAALQPTSQTPGVEVTGTLSVEVDGVVRTQEIVLKVPTAYNGSLVVLGTPGTRSQWSSEGPIVPWLVTRGYAVVVGNKGMTNGGVDGNATMFNKQHPSQHWGAMMLDMSEWAGARLAAAYGEPVTATYAVGLSNGGYQVRRALELDRLRTLEGLPPLFSGGLDWAGVYWPDARVLDTDDDDQVSPAELAAGDHLIRTNEHAALTMGYAYDPQTQTTPANFAADPPYPGAQAAMQAAGFDPASAVIWGAYNTAFDGLKNLGLTQFKGVGYYNFTGYVFRAELMGHDAAQAAAYSCYTPPDDKPPPMYAWLAAQQDAGFTQADVPWALKNATTGEFAAPLISVHGDADGLNGLKAHALAYQSAVEQYGTPGLYRLFVIAHGGHIDTHSDGKALDFDFDGLVGEEGVADRFTIMQPYAERAFLYLVDWVENGAAPPASKTVPTDPKNDILDASKLSF